MIDTNITFYQNMKLEKFKELAKVTGFDTCVDIDIIYDSYIQKKEVIVELGVGFGRCVNDILKRGYQGKIYGIDRIENYLSPKNTYSSDAKVHFLHQDIKNLSIPELADTILWMWSGILEQNTPKKQNDCIAHIYNYLKPQGVLIIESPANEIKYVGTKVDPNNIRLETEWGVLHAYLQSAEEIEQAAKDAGYQGFDKVYYQSTTGLDRVMYLLTK